MSLSRLGAVAFAAACACLPSLSSAQSSVSLYGLVDMSAGRAKPPGGEATWNVASGNMTTSFWGVKGTEDLGGGLKGIFALESFLRADTADAGRFTGDGFWARSAYVGLSSGLGTLTLGRNTTTLFVSTLLFNALGDSFGFSPSIRHYFTSGTATGDTGWSDSVSYGSPSFGGLTVKLQGAAGEGSGGKNWGGHLLYFGGPFAATLAYQKVEKGATVDDTKTLSGGVSWNFGWAKLFAQYGKVDNDTTGNSFKLADASVAVPIGAGSVLLAWGQLKPDTGAKRVTISGGYDHYLSKRTDVYAIVMRDDIDDVSPTGLSFGVGVRHRF